MFQVEGKWNPTQYEGKRKGLLQKEYMYIYIGI